PPPPVLTYTTLFRSAVGGRGGYRVMGVAMALVIAVGVVSAYRGTRSAPVGAAQPGAGSLRDQLRIVAGARDFRLLLTTFVVQALDRKSTRLNSRHVS